MKIALPGIPARRSIVPSSPDQQGSVNDWSNLSFGPYLNVVVKYHHVLPPQARAATGLVAQTLVEAEPDDVVELEFEGGIVQWVSVEQLRLDMQAQGARGVEDAIPVPTQPLGPPTSRSRWAGRWMLKGLKILGIDPVNAAGDLAEAEVISRFEERLQPKSGLHRLESPTVTADEIKSPEAFVDAHQASLIFIHGTASSIPGSYYELADKWGTLKETYGNRIYGFQHKTLSVSPVTNALDLVRLLPRGAKLHLVSHSRGGLVGELLCLEGLTEEHFAAFARKAEARDKAAPADERDARTTARSAELQALTELAKELSDKDLVIERFVRVACPARGTILASGRLDLYLSLTTSALGLLVKKAPPLIPVHEFMRSIVMEIARRRTRPQGLPGIEAQMPESPLVGLLNNTGLTSRADLAVIAGDIEAGNLFQGADVKQWLGVLATNLFYLADHDLVVNTGAMDGGIVRRDLSEGSWYFFDHGVEVSHFKYFRNPKTRDRLLGWLRAPENEKGKTFQPHRRAVAGSSRAPFQRSVVRANLPVLFVLPGIMGTLLGDGPGPADDGSFDPARLLWLNAPRLGLGGLRQLELNAKNIKPVALVPDTYGALLKHLSASYNVEAFGYDWRQSVVDAGERLATAIQAELDAGRAVRILAHSLGGLVARAMIATRPKLWDTVLAKGGRLVQLGTPTRGSFAIPRVLWGVDSSVKMLAMIDPAPLDDLCAIFASWPGVLEMLPDTRAIANGPQIDFFDHQWWVNHRGQKAAPTREALAAARQVRNKLDGAELRGAVYVAGIASQTIDGLEFADGEPVWKVTAAGDGTVPYALGRLSRPGDHLDVYYANAIHGDLANLPSAFEAISELLSTGGTTKLPTTVRADTRSVTLADGRLRDEAPLIFPTEEELLAAAVRGTSHRPSTRRQALLPLEVAVYHGDLRLARHPVVVGHYLGDKIASAEKVLDEQLAGRLTHRWKLGLYTGALGEAELIIASDTQPSGAIVVGLGQVGEITGEKIRRGVCAAAVRYALHLAENCSSHEKPASTGLSVLLLGTNGGNALRMTDSVSAVIGGVQSANRMLSAALETPIYFDALHFIELYETLAAKALYTAQRLADRLSADARQSGYGVPAQAVNVAPFLRSLGGGRYQPSLGDSDRGWWPRIIITGERSSNGEGVRYRFAIVSDRAGVEEQLIESQGRHIESFIQNGIVSPTFNPSAAANLFELLIPETLKSRLDTDSDNLILLLDREAARVPWEMLARRSNSSEQGAELDHLALRLGMVRQFKSSTMPPLRSMSRELRAIVIGDTKNEYAELPGAEREARDVAARLERRGVEVKLLAKPEADDAIDAILRPGYRILHIAAHGEYRLNDVGKSGVILGQGRYLSPIEVKAMPALPELVFFNCCHLGLLSPNSENRLASDESYRAHLARIGNANNLAASLAVALIDKGVKVVIAAGWAVDDDAASTFATVFYDQMLAGERFGDSVLHARRSTYREHPGVNTWCAYHCYGSPDFRFDLGAGSASVSVDENRTSEYRFVARTEFFQAVCDFRLHGTSGQKKLTDAELQALIERLERLTKAIPSMWQDGEMLAQIGFAYGALKERERAVEFFKRSVAHESATAPLKAIEQWVNLDDRRASKMEPAKGSKLRAEAAERLAALAPFGDTSERVSLSAALNKRQADAALDRATNEDEIEDSRRLLRLAAEAYRKAHVIAQAQSGRIDPYSAVNWITLSVIIGEGDTGASKHSELQEALREVRRAIKALSEERSDFWTRVYQPDALLLHHLLENTLSTKESNADENRQAVVKAYRQTFAGGHTESEIDSVHHNILLVAKWLGHLPGRSSDVEALEKIADELFAK
jgi:hypothetical protein